MARRSRPGCAAPRPGTDLTTVPVPRAGAIPRRQFSISGISPVLATPGDVTPGNSTAEG